jgi:hypothetical protein
MVRGRTPPKDSLRATEDVQPTLTETTKSVNLQ